jgi:hypothetical protein
MDLGFQKIHGEERDQQELSRKERASSGHAAL